MTSKQDFRFLERLRVRWAEVDMQRIVFNGHYLMYFDTAVAGWWRAMALPYHETMHLLQGDLFVRKATLEYEGSAHYDDALLVGVRCGRIGNSSMVLHAAVFRGEQRLVHGELVYVFADPATQKSKPLPAPLRAAFERFDSGRPMIDVAVGGWAEQGGAARTLRQTVFVDEQRIPAEMAVDDDDEGAVHAVARNAVGLAVASGRLLQAAPGVAKIGRMATLAAVRGAGVGGQVLQALLGAARARGDSQVVLNAQLAAVPFYERAGFVGQGDVFTEAGIRHLEMRRAL